MSGLRLSEFHRSVFRPFTWHAYVELLFVGSGLLSMKNNSRVGLNVRDLRLVYVSVRESCEEKLSDEIVCT